MYKKRTGGARRQEEEKENIGEKTDRDIKRLKNIVGKVAEDVKIRLDQMIQDFLAHSELSEITFPNLLSSTERAYVHFQATKHGLRSFSTGAGSDRRLTLRRALESTSVESKPVALTQASLTQVAKLMREFPQRTQIDFADQQHDTHLNGRSAIASAKGFYALRLCGGPTPKVPKRRKTESYLGSRSRLPIWGQQDRILDAIDKHRVVFIKGDTGCGKTTQVPQFILDDATFKSKEARIVCTVPRRIAAVSVSERVATERGERLGQTVGYQIRLESCISPCETLLTYCTSGVLLRSLTPPDYGIIRKTTHIIIDEVHERDRQTDFLLACLKDILTMFPDLRLILMGADLNNELFSTYFGGFDLCPTIHVEGRLHPVQIYHLEEVLEMLRYENYDMRSTKRQADASDVYNRLVESLQSSDLSEGLNSGAGVAGSQYQAASQGDISNRPDVDGIIQQVWTTGDESAFAEYLRLVDSREVSVNYQHSIVGVTMLMAAAVRGLLEYVTTLLQFGANLDIKSKIDDYDFSVIEWASDHRQHEVLKFLLEYQYTTKLMPAVHEQSQNSEKYKRLATYLSSIDEERVDLLLILRLLHQIHNNSDPSHAVLIFLPGYDEIVTLKHLILTDTQLGFRHGSFVMFMLHSNIQTGDQRAAFELPPRGIRKIVLSTNIAESSLTIEDVVYVIDSGKAKEKSYDSMTSVTQLKSVWISKASVNQRRGRAGRCRGGICYHLFSAARYEAMSDFQVPEIVRTSLQELCLFARCFMKIDVSIEEFFNRIPEPPAPIAVKKSVELLKVMGALDEDEQLTKLGLHLLDFPLEPFLGKALIYAVVFKCLDPILTLVTVISYRDPFQLPSDPREKEKAHERKCQFARGSFSDHMAFLKSFQDWEKSKMFREGTERRFCRDNYLSSVTFEMICAIRQQLIGQLRASGFVRNKGDGDTKGLNANSKNWALVKGVLVATLYPNICGVDRIKNVLYNSYNTKVSFHPSTTVTTRKSVTHGIPTEWIIFDEMTQQGHVNLVKGCTCVGTSAMALFAGRFNDVPMIDEDEFANGFDGNSCSVRPSTYLNINNWIKLKGTKETIEVLTVLRQKVTKLVLKRLMFPTANNTQEDERTIQTISSLLMIEDAALGFPNVEGIDQWPKLVSGNLMSAPRAGFGKTVDQASEVSRFSTGTTNCRYFVVELVHITQIADVIKSEVWLVPDLLLEKLRNDKSDQGLLAKKDVIVFLWLPTTKAFAGAIKLLGSSNLAFLTEVPIQVLGNQIISLQSAEHQIGFKSSCDFRMDGLELEYGLGAALLRMFEGTV